MTDQPSNAPDDLGAAPREDLTAASILTGDRSSVGGAAFGTGMAGTPGGTSPGTSPNSPIDVPLPAEGANDDASTQRDAVRQAADAPPSETHPSSM